MIVEAATLTAFQSCQRKGLLELDGWRPLRWLPKSLFTHLLRSAMTKVCSGEPVAEVAAWAEMQLLETAADPGLEVATDPYKLAKDYCAMLHTIIRSQFRSLQPRVPRLHELPLHRLSPSCYWKFSSQQDDTGRLHRWVVWEAMSDDRLSRELHGWACFGDIAIARAPMTLHVILIGRRAAGGRQECGWARCWESKMGIRFRRKYDEDKKDHNRGGHVKPNYNFADGFFTKQWLSDMRHQSPDEWVDQMWKDGEAQALYRKLDVKRPFDPVCRATEAQVAEESERILFTQMDSKPWWQRPMSRGACDSFAPCAYQAACYQPDPSRSPQLLQLGYQQKAQAEVDAAFEAAYPPHRTGYKRQLKSIPMPDTPDTADEAGE